MSLLQWVLVGFVLYWAGLILVSRAGLLPASVQTQGPMITVRTRRGRALLDRLSAPRRFWRAWGNFGVGIALVIMLGMFLAVVNAGIAALFSPEQTAVSEPRNVLVIPGVNDFLPLSATPEIVAGLVIGLVVHEGGHGLLCRVEDIDIDSMGIALIGIIPLGAFVQPDERSQLMANRGAKSRMFAAGVMNNFVVTIVAFAVLFALVGGMIATAPGAGVGDVVSGSAADDAGLGPGDRIVAVDDTPIENESQLDDYLAETSDEQITVELANGDVVTVDRSVQVIAAVEHPELGIELGDRIERVDGEPVMTEAEFREALGPDRTATISTSSGDRTIPIGAYVDMVDADGPLAAAGAPTDTSMVITAIDGERTTSTDEAQLILSGTEPGQTVEIEVMSLGSSTPQTYEVTLDTHPSGHGLVGVSMHPGVSGLSMTDFGTQLYPSEQFLSTLGGDGDEPSLFGLDSFFGKVFTAMVLPIAAIFGGGIEHNFAGFTGVVTDFYSVQGPLAGAEWLVFLSVNVLFWTGWINFNLGIFNCIPAFPLDGGHLLRSSAETVISRLPVSNPYVAVKYVTVSVGLTMLAGLLVMVFGQGLLS